MTEIVRYTGRWNRLLMKPFAGYDWLDPEQAKALYEQRPGPGVIVVGGSSGESETSFVPRWVIGFGTSAGVRVQFFTPLGTLWRLIDYDFVNARLWRWITVDYQYPSDSKHWQQNEFTREIETSVRPDGTGHFTTVDATDPASIPTTSSDPIEVPVRESYWLERPAFGDWDRLADPGPSAWEVAGQPVPTRTS